MKFSYLAKGLLLPSILALQITAHAQQATLVATEPVKKITFHDQLTLVGRTEARVHSRIVAEISGRVISIDAPEGNPVKKGQALVSIDPSITSFDQQAKMAEETEAQVQADLARTNLKRVEELYQQNLVPNTTLDSAKAWVQIANARHTRLQAERQRLDLDLANCTIRSPYNGYTLRQLVDVGEWVSPGTPVYETVDLSRVKVTVDLPERHYGLVSIGSKAVITISSDESREYQGKISGIARNASSDTHTFEVIITVDNDDRMLAGGKLVRATLFLDHVFESLAISKDAIVRNGLNTTVYTIVDGKATPIPVMTSSTDGTMIAVSAEGLSEGMPVVVRGNERIFPGSPVTTGEEQNEQAAGEPTAESNK